MKQTLVKERELVLLKSSFASMASHEFRTPLTTIQTATDLLAYYNDQLSQQERMASLHDIQGAINRMRGVMENMLVLGKLETRAGEAELQPMDVAHLLAQLAFEVESADGHRHPIQIQAPSSAPSACLNEALMRQIIGNLLNNACKYSRPGQPVQLEWRHEAGQLLVDVIDLGIGIPADDVPRLFKTFHRASNVGTVQGTGLGLSIVQRAVDSLGGRVQVTSTLGQGTRMQVALPWLTPTGTNQTAAIPG
jgi:signal transduction histidine kinase